MIQIICKWAKCYQIKVLKIIKRTINKVTMDVLGFQFTNCLAIDYLIPLESNKRLSSLCFPPLCFTVLARFTALFRTSLS